MLKWVTAYRRLLADRAGCVLRNPARVAVINSSLLLAVFLSGIVPQGFMRIAGDEGMMLVLCTPEGPTEMWLTDDGRTLTEQPAEPPVQAPSDCLAVTLSLVMVQAWFATIVAPVEFAVFRPALVDLQDALVFVRAPQQPRAPPRFSQT